MPLPIIRQISRLLQPGPNINTFFVADGSGVAYQDSWTNLAADYGTAPPALPGNAIARIYVQGVENNLTDGLVWWADSSLTWSYGDSVIAALSSILSAQMTRRVPPGGLTQTQAARANEMYAICRKEIESGFKSAALGSDHFYDSSYAARTNLNTAVAASLVPDLPSDWTTPFWCKDMQGVSALRDHTATQIQKVNSDLNAMITAISENLSRTYAEIEKAKDVGEVEAVMWRRPLNASSG